MLGLRSGGVWKFRDLPSGNGDVGEAFALAAIRGVSLAAGREGRIYYVTAAPGGGAYACGMSRATDKRLHAGLWELR